MKILLITGKLAEPRVREIAGKFNCGVVVAPVQTASCLTPELIIQSVKSFSDFDVLLVPGLLKNDLNIIEKSTGIKTFRGPKDVADLEYVLESIKSIKLSKEIPADELIKEKLKTRALERLKTVNSSAYIKKMLKKPGNIMVGSLPVGRDFPVRVLAEIVDAGNLSKKELLKQAEYLKNSGADIIDLGFNEKNPAAVKSAVRLLKKKINLPVSVDTMEKENIRAAIGRANMILSFDSELLHEFSNVTTPSVIIPKRGNMHGPEERIKILEKNIELARKRGFKRIIADLILQPVNFGFVDSIMAYRKFSEKHSYPILMGAGNITELFDADSVGINALLCAIASECSASIVFTTEASDKTRGSVRELATASKMMHLSRLRNSLPKDLGIDLLLLKEKRIIRERLDRERLQEKVKAKTAKKHPLDEKGYFKIFVGEKIECVHYFRGKPNVCIEGKNAREICDTIYTMRLISDYSHALYLGRELQKAEFALKFGKSYLQS